MKRLLTILLILAHAPFAFAACCFSPELDVIGQGGNFRGGGGVEAWMPIAQDPCRVLFLQGGGGYFRHQGVGSVGLGYRQQIGPGLAYGLNGFGDISVSEHGFSYGQIGGGFELLACHGLFRFNGYAPFGDRRTFSSEPGATLDETAIIGLDLTRFETSLPGFDLEGGGQLNLGPGELWGYAGYFFHKRNNIRAVQGPRLRLEYRLNVPKLRAQLVFGGWWEHDWLHGSTGSLALEVRFPYCRPKGRCAPLCELMGRRVVREHGIWLDAFPAVRETGQIGTLIFANESIDGIGTQTDPATIDNAFGMSGPNDYLFLLQDTGNMVPSATLVLQSFQRVIGFGNGSQFTIKTANGALLTINDLTGAGRGIVDGSTATISFSTDSNNLFQGIGTVDTSVGIRMDQFSDSILVKDVVIAANPIGILNECGSNLFVQDSRITAGTTGIDCRQVTGIFEVRNTEITASTGIFCSQSILERGVVSSSKLTTTSQGVFLSSIGGTFVVNDCRIIGARTGVLVTDNPAIAQSKDVRVLDCEMSGLDLRGIDVVNDSEAASIYVFNRNTINGNSEEAIRMDIDQGFHSIEIVGNTLNSLTADGLLIDVSEPTNILAQANRGTTGGSLIEINPSGGGSIQRNISLLNNNSLSAPAGIDGYIIASSATAPVCATILGNNRVVTPLGIDVDGGGSNIDVFDLPNLSANNNGLDVNTANTVNTTTRCPLPDIPPLNFPI